MRPSTGLYWSTKNHKGNLSFYKQGALKGEGAKKTRNVIIQPLIKEKTICLKQMLLNSEKGKEIHSEKIIQRSQILLINTQYSIQIEICHKNKNTLKCRLQTWFNARQRDVAMCSLRNGPLRSSTEWHHMHRKQRKEEAEPQMLKEVPEGERTRHSNL